MFREFFISRSVIGTCGAAAMLFLAACDTQPGTEESSAAPAAATAPATATAPANTNAHNMRLVGTNDLQARSAYQPVVHAYGDRRILFVGHHEGRAVNPNTGEVEENGMSIVDVTDPSAPVYLRHVPANGDASIRTTYGSLASGSKHIQICDGSVLPNGDPNRVYLTRTNGLMSYEMFDVTDPAEPQLLSTIAETGVSGREVSNRGNRETHKSTWDCETGIGYFNGTPEGWRVTRLLQTFDLNDPDQPRHIRDYGLPGWEPGAEGPLPDVAISGLHQPTVVGNRIYVAYGSGNSGTVQILDRDKFLNGNPEAEDPYAPTPENLLYPQIARLDMPSFWGAHTAKPIYGIEIPDYADDGELNFRDILIVISEGGGVRCPRSRDVVFLIDITQEDKPFPISTYQVEEASGDFCSKGGRFGPHGMNDTYHPGFEKSLFVIAYFNAGIRAVDYRNPFQPVEVGYYVPEPTENTTELCATVDGSRICDSEIQTNNVDIDDRGYVYAVDRSSTGLHIVELTGEAREIVGLD